MSSLSKQIFAITPQISTLRMEDLPANLSNLFLDYNKFESLTADLSIGLSKMEKVRLGHNMYKCSCDAYELHEFIEVQ